MSSNMVTLTTGNWNAWFDYIYPTINVLGAWDCVNPGWDRPITGAPSNAEERKELREWSKAQGTALGAILESIDAPNKRLVKGKNTKDAFTLLKITHNQSDDARQFQLFQKIITTHQNPGETLPVYFQRIEAACDSLQASLTTEITHLTLLDMLAAFIAVSNTQEDEDNTFFIQSLHVTGSLSRSNTASKFQSEQIQQDTMATVKETSLAARTGRPRREPKPGSDTCAHCKKAYKSDDCYTKDPHKMCEWMQIRNKEEYERRAQQQAAKLCATTNAAIAKEADKDESPEAAKMAKPTETPKTASSLASLSSISFANESGSQTRAPFCL
ncbi:hypothetical protein FRC00_011714 [Tulasnella sp. 408]|nr:hypothetical protein FRC00_011714 [Tulasnella sp. 408]